MHRLLGRQQQHCFKVVNERVCDIGKLVRTHASAVDNIQNNRKSKQRLSPMNASQKPIRVHEELIYGKHVVNAALRAGRRRFHQLFVRNDELSSSNNTERAQFSSKTAELMQLATVAQQFGVPVIRVPVRVLDILVPSCVHQGVVADCSRMSTKLIQSNEEVDEFSRRFESDRSAHIHLFLDRLVDPQNLGAVIRSAVFFGASRDLLLTANDSSAPSAAASKASSGAMELCNVHRVASPRSLLEAVKSRMDGRVELIAAVARKPDLARPASTTDEKAILSLAEYVARKRSGKAEKVLLVVGSEGRGIAEPIVDVCDSLVTIEAAGVAQPHADLVDCLNVSNAVAVLLHCLTDSFRQY